jgi:hypothetical protein
MGDARAEERALPPREVRGREAAMRGGGGSSAAGGFDDEGAAVRRDLVTAVGREAAPTGFDAPAGFGGAPVFDAGALLAGLDAVCAGADPRACSMIGMTVFNDAGLSLAVRSTTEL